MASRKNVDELLENRAMIEAQYELWKNDPSSVEKDWDHFFQGFSLAMCPRPCVADDRARDQSSVASLIYAYRSLGHLAADVNPLEKPEENPPFLAIESFGLGKEDLDEVYDTGHLGGPERATLSEIVGSLRRIYLGTLGIEYVHIQNKEERRWLQGVIEPTGSRPGFSAGDKLRILQNLSDAELFEAYLQKRYPGQKRFSLEGLESLIVAVHTIVEEAPAEGVEEIVFGMAHRGRLNVLANILDKPYEEIFSEFEDITRADAVAGSGDVKYHKGFSSDHVNRFGRNVHLSLTPNPSHLEAVDPVALGRTRAKQRLRGDSETRSRVIPVLIHGDAAFAGQGIVAECLNLASLQGYTVGGTIHIIANNQIGFTTAPQEGRSTRYCTEVAKMTEAPVFHVNAEDPEMVAYCSMVALRYRQKFKKDVVIDVIGYRKYGHSESDEPSFTQPRLYRAIRARRSVKKIYTDRLLSEDVLTEAEIGKRAEEFERELENALGRAREAAPPAAAKPGNKGRWNGFMNGYSFDRVKSSVDRRALRQVLDAITTVPPGFNIHPKLQKRLMEIARFFDAGKADWAMAEQFAFGTLLMEGHGIRLSGEDSQRGTFSHRHSVYRDTETEEPYTPLNHVSGEQGKFCVYNSMLSEFAVLGFDYGYSLVDPNMMVLWEAQFGDFANGGQVIIDQFVSSSLQKWTYASGLVMLLPHGSEGQGPEHSHAYLERYLQLAAEENIEVVNLTKASQYFHLLRRQMKRNFRRPLVVMAPKSILRHPMMLSDISDFENGGFEEFLGDPGKPAEVSRLLLCSGKIAFDLLEAREKAGVNYAAIVRVEQLYPFDRDKFMETVKPYSGAKEVAWVQEETLNRGAWALMREKIVELLGVAPLYIGRKAAASPAGGSAKAHAYEQKNIVNSALRIGE